MRYIIHPSKAAISAVVMILSLALTAVLLVCRLWLAACLFFLVAVVYGFVLHVVGSNVVINEEGVTKQQFFKKPIAMKWGQIREVGVIGIRVVNHENSRQTGPRYIYFSNADLSTDERFDLGLRWPPKEQIYLRFSNERIWTVQRFWRYEIALYNAGKVYLDGARTKKAKGDDDVLS